MKRTPREAADRILQGYRQVCEIMTPHASFAPEESSDNAVILAVEYLREHDSGQQGGPISSERWTLDELLAELAKWKTVASGKTCVSFENICYGASSLWHQTHRENFRAVDRKPEELSRWVLKYANCVMEDFPAQVLQMLESLAAENERLKTVAANQKP